MKILKCPYNPSSLSSFRLAESSQAPFLLLLLCFSSPPFFLPGVLAHGAMEKLLPAGSTGACSLASLPSAQSSSPRWPHARFKPAPVLAGRRDGWNEKPGRGESAAHSVAPVPALRPRLVLPRGWSSPGWLVRARPLGLRRVLVLFFKWYYRYYLLVNCFGCCCCCCIGIFVFVK